MPFGRLSVVGLCLLAEAAWIACALELLSWAVAQREAIVPFWAVLLIVLGAWATGRAAPTYAHQDGDEIGGQWRARQALIGAVLSIFGLAAGGASGPGLSPLWPWSLITGQLGGGQVLALATGAGICLLAWRRGVVLALDGPTPERLNTLFVAGLAVVLLVAVVDAACGCGLLSPWLAGVFFATSLGALALAQLPGADERTAAWSRVVAVAVAVVLGIAVLLGYLGSALGGDVLASLGRLWRSFVELAITGISVILGPLLELVFNVLERLKGLFADQDISLNLPRGPSVSSDLRHTLSDSGSPLRHLVELFLLLGLAWVLYQGFMLGFRSRFRLAGAMSGDRREHLGEEASALADMRDLLLGLLPEWMRQPRPMTPRWPSPPADPALARVFAIYFEMLELALDQGWELDLTRTPSERIGALERALPGAPVGTITALFNAACYAGRAPPGARIEALRSELEAERTAT